MDSTDYLPLWRTDAKQQSSLRLYRIAVVVLALYSGLCTLLFLTNTSPADLLAGRRQYSNRPKASLLKPFNKYIRYEVREPENSGHSDIFSAPPSEEVEAAWNKLIHGNRGDAHGLQLSREEAKQLGIKKGLLTPDDGIAVITGVHHNLHCLRRIRQQLYSDFYFANATAEELAEDRHHAIHCIEAMRASFVCRPDLAMHPYLWGEDRLHPLIVSSGMRQECVDWNTVEEAMDSHAYNYEDTMRQHRVGVV